MIYPTNPGLADTDGDGLDDYNEIFVYQTNPLSSDTDNDNLTDYEEVTIGSDGYITNPLIVDTDGDGYSDYKEVTSGTDPTNANDFPGSSTESSGPIFVSIVVISCLVFILLGFFARRRKMK
ncbi:MAG: thrombospondin type 3 repeat-containing protein [Candidatus Heimdallarchaeota archaeon]|nr:thrombospondin type 3 repeat-containing protein [Candidatus Heimdallarchaeota archaeon]